MSRRRRLAAVVATVTALTAGGALTAVAQVPPTPVSPTTPTTSTTSTTEPPPPQDAPSQPTPGPSAPSDGGGGSGDANATPAQKNQIPPEYQKLIASVRRTPANNTRALVADLAQLEAYGLTAEQAAIVGMGRFPVAGVATFGDDWWYPRFVPTFHLHVGTDIFAAYGMPVRAPVDGRVRITNGKVGGLAVYVYMPDNTYFYMAHLSGLAPGLANGQQVKTGDVVGYVGDSGDAKGGAPHCHFEIHPRGGGPIDPKPYLDQFVSDARGQVPLLVAYYRTRFERDQQAETGAPAAPAPPAPPPPPPVARVDVGRRVDAPLLWAASMDPMAGAMGVAETELLAAAEQVDWDARDVDSAVDVVVRAYLAPLTPPAFAGFL